jgi:hypothetical protein
VAPNSAAQSELEIDDTTLTPEEKNFLDYVVKQALRSLFGKDASPDPDMTPHEDQR